METKCRAKKGKNEISINNKNKIHTKLYSNILILRSQIA